MNHTHPGHQVHWKVVSREYTCFSPGSQVCVLGEGVCVKACRVGRSVGGRGWEAVSENVGANL